MKLKELIRHYNETQKTGMPKMTLTRLGYLVDPTAGKTYMYHCMWRIANHKAKYIKISYALAICKILGCDINHLFGWNK